MAPAWFSEAGKADRVDVEGRTEPFRDVTCNDLLRWTAKPRLVDGAPVLFYTVVLARFKEN